MAHSENPDPFDELPTEEQQRIHRTFQQGARLILRTDDHLTEIYTAIRNVQQDGGATGDLHREIHSAMTDFSEAWGVASGLNCPPNSPTDERIKAVADNLVASPEDAPAVDAHLASIQQRTETMLTDAALVEQLDARAVEAVNEHAPVVLGAVYGAREALELGAFHHPSGKE